MSFACLGTHQLRGPWKDKLARFFLISICGRLTITGRGRAEILGVAHPVCSMGATIGAPFQPYGDRPAQSNLMADWDTQVLPYINIHTTHQLCTPSNTKIHYPHGFSQFFFPYSRVIFFSLWVFPTIYMIEIQFGLATSEVGRPSNQAVPRKPLVVSEKHSRRCSL